MSEEEATQLKSALAAAGPRAYMPDLALAVAETGPFDLQSTLGVLTTTGSLYMTRDRTGEDIEATVEKVVSASESAGLTSSEEERDRLGQAMTMLLGARAIRLTMKAGDLLMEVDNPFSEARILTDFRPLFEEDATFECGVLTHTLRFSFISGQTVSIALDESDLGQIEAQLVRARAKAASMRESLEDRGITCISPIERT